MNKIDKEELIELAELIIENLKCHCDFDNKKSQKEPCACSWVPIEVWFSDHDVDFKELRLMTSEEVEEWNR